MAPANRYEEEAQAIALARTRTRSRSRARTRSIAVAENSKAKLSLSDIESVSDDASLVDERDFKHKQVRRPPLSTKGVIKSDQSLADVQRMAPVLVGLAHECCRAMSAILTL